MREEFPCDKAIEDFGLNPGDIAHAALRNDILGYVEFHIEQGPVLENTKAAARSGRSHRWPDPPGVHISWPRQPRGYDAHASSLRRHRGRRGVDYCGRAGCAHSIPSLVATVGTIEAKPGATNVIAGEARLTLDIRHGLDEIRAQAVDDLIRQAEEIAKRRGLSVSRNVLLSQRAVAMDPFLVCEVELAVRKTGCEPHRMVSGAGHDAMILAEKVPAAMIFLRTQAGSATTLPNQSRGTMWQGLECGLHLLDQLASSSTLQKRMCRA